MLPLPKLSLEFQIDKLTAFLVAILPFAAATSQAETREFEGFRYHIYELDPSQETLQIFLNDPSGKPFNTFKNLEAHLNHSGQRLKFAMNAGIYEPGYIPSGLYIENGKTLVGLNRNPPPPKKNPTDFTPNFFLQPNGVFFIDAKGAGVMETEAFAKSQRQPRLATQSGPLLVKNGEIHPVFTETSTSRLIRNGVGVTKEGKVLFIASERSEKGRTNFHNFASLFIGLGCPNALYLDGDISEFYLRSDEPAIQATTAFAGILAIVEPIP